MRQPLYPDGTLLTLKTSISGNHYMITDKMWIHGDWWYELFCPQVPDNTNLFESETKITKRFKVEA